MNDALTKSIAKVNARFWSSKTAALKERFGLSGSKQHSK